MIVIDCDCEQNLKFEDVFPYKFYAIFKNLLYFGYVMTRRTPLRCGLNMSRYEFEYLLETYIINFCVYSCETSGKSISEGSYNLND